jgi:hypothetical protein
MGIHRFLELGDFFIGLPELFGVCGCVLGFPGGQKFKRSGIN